MTPLTPAAVTALAQQAAESPAHLDPVLVQQVCREWETMRERLYWFEKAGGVAMATRVHTIMNERDAALAERAQRVREQRNLAIARAERAEAGLIKAWNQRDEARRVLRDINTTWALHGISPALQSRIAAVLAQEGGGQ